VIDDRVINGCVGVVGILALIALLVLLLTGLFLSLDSADNTYNIWTGQIACFGYANCRHEVGHAADANANWVSDSAEFQEAVQAYRTRIWLDPTSRDVNSPAFYSFPGIGSPLVPHRHITSASFWRGGWGGYRELYASLISWYTEETMPGELKEFYDFAYVERRLREVQDSQ
jgi:hypothetical protein